MLPTEEDEELSPESVDASLLEDLLKHAQEAYAQDTRARLGKPSPEAPAEEAMEGEAVPEEEIPGVEPEEGAMPEGEGGKAPMDVEKLKAVLAKLKG